MSGSTNNQSDSLKLLTDYDNAEQARLATIIAPRDGDVTNILPMTFEYTPATREAREKSKTKELQEAVKDAQVVTMSNAALLIAEADRLCRDYRIAQATRQQLLTGGLQTLYRRYRERI